MFANDRQMSAALDRWLTTEPEGTEDDFDELSFCPACGDTSDYCQGHGEIGDPVGWAVLQEHDAGLHARCHPRGCEESYYLEHPEMREG